MSAVVVIQARAGSSRFPGKVLAPLNGRPMLAVMLRRLAPLALAHQVVVATSKRSLDDDVADVALAGGAAVVRGSEADVLARFHQVLAQHPADVVVRLTADCPLLDPRVVLDVLELQQQTGVDYASNTLARTYPDGIDVEVMTAEALRAAHARSVAAEEREHVTPYLLRHPRSFRIAQLLHRAQAGEERWTVDLPEDLDVVRTALSEAGLDATWEQILAAVGRRAVIGPLVAAPLPVEHVEGEPLVRRWTLMSPRHRGTATVVVDEGGVGTLGIDCADPVEAERAIRGRLGADLQVTRLTTPNGAAT